ncbi:MAG: flagellar hook-associated protein FlgL [Desulfovibrio sp.]|nr:flagellar hook-associated protein FlgL [Desulfovibrio sp.]MBI4960870.1 flagellar hook-associated protein FlgL [Desulfovibrio sp.]
MRISQNMIYSGSIQYMNSALSNLAAAQEQSASQKKINRPSDDPAGYAEARNLNTIIKTLDQYSDNINVAKSWLNQADSSLLEVSTAMTSIRELAEQAATGTLSAENRQEIATQVRALFSQVLSLANTTVSGNSIFAGQKTNGAAFTEILYATVEDSTLTQDAVISVAGGSDTSVLVHFSNSGTIGGTADIAYAYSSDGGTTWTSGTLAAGSTTLDLGGCSVTLKNGSVVTASGTGGGTSLTLRPSALYLGDDQDGATVRKYGASLVNATADGEFSGNVTVRIASNSSLPGPISYSYSLDGGMNWVGGNVASNSRLLVPGGYLVLASNGGGTLASGDQLTIVPNTADINVGISPSGAVVINSVGKDVFGGLYKAAGASNASVVFGSGSSKNIFETIGSLIGHLETNDMDGVGDDLESLTIAQAYLETCTASVGARENRLDFAENTISVLRDNAETNLSAVEDADITQVLIDLSKYQYTYQSVLASSTKIMGMSLLDYI